MISKGIVTSITDGGVRVKPYKSGDLLTPILKADDAYAVGDIVAYVLFDDNTGFILRGL